MKNSNYKFAMLTLIAAMLFSYGAIAQNDHRTAVTHKIEVKGASFSYRVFGKKGGVPIVFLQHFTGTMDNWDPALTDGFAKTHEVILFDNRGIGSSTGETPNTIEAMADDATAFIDALGYKQVDLLGFSVGGFIAQEVAIGHPSLVRKLILAGTGPRGGDITDNQPVLENKEKLTPPQQLLQLFFDATPTSQANGNEFLKRISARQVNRDANTKVPSILAQNDAINKFKADKDAEYKNLLNIHQPVLVVNGIHDRMVPASNSYVLVSHIKNAKLILYPDSGHGALFQYHDDFVKQANSFLN